MKVNELQQLIRRMVKEEVANEVSKAMGKVLVEMVKEIKKTSTAPVLSEEVEVPVPVLRTNNPKLTAVLAETARSNRCKKLWKLTIFSTTIKHSHFF